MTNQRPLRFAFSLVFASAVALAVTTAGCASEIDEEGALPSTTDPADEADPHEDEDSVASFSAPDDSAELGADGLDTSPALDDELGELADVGARTIRDGAEEIDLGPTSELAARAASPVPGRRVTYAYGVRNPRYAAGFHTGQDYAAPRGHAVVAVRSGRIRGSNDRGGAYGKWMGLDADNGRTYVYCHLSSRRYAAGKRVAAGQRIGRVGATGNVTGPHLHFEDHPRGPFRYAQVRKPRW